MRPVAAMRDRDVARSAREAYRIAIRVMFAATLAVAASVVRADDDLPGRVGRVADFSGQLYLSTQDRPDAWTPVGINYPVSSGDNLWASNDGRAEVDYGGGQFRIAGDTSVNVARLEDHALALFVARGRLVVRVRVLDTEDVARVDTPNTQIELARPGLYRIEVGTDASTTKLAVREGEGFIAVAAGAQQVLPVSSRPSPGWSRSVPTSGRAWAPTTASTPGAQSAIDTTSGQLRHRMCRVRWSDSRSSALTAAGRRALTTGRSGIRPRLPPTGRRTRTDTGRTSALGD